MSFYSQSIAACFENVKSGFNGLSSEDAALRARKFKSERIEKQKQSSLFKKFLMQFADLMIMILLAAALVSFIIGAINHTSSEIIDGAVILAIVLMNAVFGMLQENKAEKSLLALEKMSQPEAVILRDGKQIKIKTEIIVPGDVIVLEAGTILPADCRLIESSSLYVDESSLTGESYAVEKNANCICKESTPLSERKNMVYNGTNVVKGRGLALVVSVGKASELGKIAGALSNTKKELTPLQKGIKDLGKIITYLILGMAVVTFIIEIIAKHNPMEAFLTAVAISVAAIP